MTSKQGPKHYELFLPVFKQGDDLSHHLESTKDASDAFLGLAEQYEAAAGICKRVAGVIREAGASSGIEVDACTHYIGITGPEAAFAGLVSDGIVSVPDWEDADEEDEEDEDEEDEDEDVANIEGSDEEEG